MSFVEINKLDTAAACSKYPPLFPRKSKISFLKFCLSSLSMALFTSSMVVAENLLNNMYPVSSSSIVAAPTLYIGMSSLIIVTSKGSSWPMRCTDISTLVPFLPLSFFTTSSFVIL